MAIAINPPAPTAEHLAQLHVAREASRKIRRAVSVANFDGWAIAAFAAITLVTSYTSVPGIILGVGMTYVAWQELSSGAALRRLDITAPKRLAINQLVLCGLLIFYFGWSLYQSLTSPGDISELVGSASDSGALGDLGGLTRQISIITYVSLMLGSVLFQGGTAWYYAKRIKVLETFLATTPQWIIDYQRGGGTL